MKEEGLYSDSEDSVEEQKVEEEKNQPSKRGRKAIPEKWNRVISVMKDDLSTIRTFELAPERLLDQSFNVPRPVGRPAAW